MGKGDNIAMNESFPERLAVIVLGYVVLLLAVVFGKHFPVVGLRCIKRVRVLWQGYDSNVEISLERSRHLYLHFVWGSVDLKSCDLFNTVPMPHGTSCSAIWLSGGSWDL